MLALLAEENSKLLEKIEALPEGESLCHGDFHPGNVMVKPDGSAVVIDFINVCRGLRNFDMARTFFLLKEVDASQTIANLYLQKMGSIWEEIEQFVEIIAEYRVVE